MDTGSALALTGVLGEIAGRPPGALSGCLPHRPRLGDTELRTQEQNSGTGIQAKGLG